MATLSIDAHEDRFLGFADVTGDFLKADQEDFVVVKF